MKFAHVSDTHLGQYRSKKDRIDDTYNAFEQVITKCIEEKIDFLIITGDIFDRSHPANDAILFLMKQFLRLKENDIQSYFILGDHDQPKTRQNAIHWIYSMTNSARHLGDSNPIKFKDVILYGFDHHDVGNDLDELIEKFKIIDTEVVKHNGHRILVLHQGLNDVHKFAGELNASDLPKNFTYYAIGDIHKNFEKKYDFLGGPLVYPGSIELASTEPIKESAKGFYIIDISSEKAIPKWIELELRPRFEIEVDVNDVEKKIDELILKINSSHKPLVSLTVTNVEDFDQIRPKIEQLQENVLELSYSTKLTDEQYPILTDESESIDDDFKRLATENIGPELAKMAFEKLYPLLNENKKEIKEIIMKNFEEFKAGKKK
jgi:DNA repair exonuclease SbcCD nuclease subunit